MILNTASFSRVILSRVCEISNFFEAFGKLYRDQIDISAGRSKSSDVPQETFRIRWGWSRFVILPLYDTGKTVIVSIKSFQDRIFVIMFIFGHLLLEFNVCEGPRV